MKTKEHDVETLEMLKEVASELSILYPDWEFDTGIKKYTNDEEYEALTMNYRKIPGWWGILGGIPKTWGKYRQERKNRVMGECTSWLEHQQRLLKIYE